jgi:uncharacterized protein
MGLEFFSMAIEYQHRYRQPGMHVQNAFQTNGTLLNDEWCAFFYQNHFLVGLSIDGPRRYHDAYRLDKGGQTTFERVMHAASLLHKHNVEFNTLTCVNSANAGHGLEVYRFLRDEVGSRYMQFIPIVERDNPSGNQEGNRITTRSVDGLQYGSFLIEVFDEWVRRDIAHVFVQTFDAALAAWAGEPSGLCVFDETCGVGLAMEFNGDLYSCDHFVEPRYFLGNINQQSLSSLARSPQQQEFGRKKSAGLPTYCHACEVQFVCNGGCPKDRILKTPDRSPGLNYLCAGYRSFFNYIDQPVRHMAAYLKSGKAPAEIMPIMAAIPRLSETPIGTECPCGSHRPVEDCHLSPRGFSPSGITTAPPGFRTGRKRHEKKASGKSGKGV